MDTIFEQAMDGRRRRRRHSDEFKADAVSACMQPGVSIAAVALSRGINANLLRRWLQHAEATAGTPARAPADPRIAAAPVPAFLPMQLPAPAVANDGIRIELRRGPTTMLVTWPANSAGECAAWMRELLR